MSETGKKPVTLRFYALAEDGSTPIPMEFNQWMRWNLHAHRHLFEDVVDGVRISTVFTGLSTVEQRESLLYETMIFGGQHDGEYCRCNTYDEAMQQHREALAIIRDDDD